MKMGQSNVLFINLLDFLNLPLSSLVPRLSLGRSGHWDEANFRHTHVPFTIILLHADVHTQIHDTKAMTCNIIVSRHPPAGRMVWWIRRRETSIYILQVIA